MPIGSAQGGILALGHPKPRKSLFENCNLPSSRETHMQKIVTFLWFDNQAEEAMNLYVSVFKNSRVFDVARYGAGGPGKEGTVMTCRFELEGQQFMALNGGPLSSSQKRFLCS
jgi:hypothetical protein